VRCVSAGAERRGGVLCADPAYVVIPQGKKKKKKERGAGEKRQSASARPVIKAVAGIGSFLVSHGLARSPLRSTLCASLGLCKSPHSQPPDGTSCNVLCG
jgi:hypothetical protein